jgi:hypothetical protein
VCSSRTCGTPTTWMPLWCRSYDIKVAWVRLFQSEAPAGGHAARPPPVPGPLTWRTAPRRPARPRTPRPPPATAPGPRPAHAREVTVRAWQRLSWQRPRRHIAAALAPPAALPGGTAGRVRGRPGPRRWSIAVVRTTSMEHCRGCRGRCRARAGRAGTGRLLRPGAGDAAGARPGTRSPGRSPQDVLTPQEPHPCDIDVVMEDGV